MTCVSKEHEIKTKLVLEQWLQLKMSFLFFCWVELTFGGQGIKIWWGGRRMSKFLAGRGDSHRSFILLYIYIYKRIKDKRTLPAGLYIQWSSSVYITYIMCQRTIWPSYFCKIWALCVSQIFMVYVFTCVFSVHNTRNLSHHEHV